MICNMDCFNCEFPDCIKDDISENEIMNLERADEKIRISNYSDQYKRQLESNHRYRQRNRQRESMRNSLNYLLHKDNEDNKERVRRNNRAYKARVRERQAG